MSFTPTCTVKKLLCMHVKKKKRKKKGGPSKTLSYFDIHYGCPFDKFIVNQNLKERNSKGVDLIEMAVFRKLDFISIYM